MYRQLDWLAPARLLHNASGPLLAWRERVARLDPSNRRLLMGFAAALFTGCLSPTLPMPPPSRPDIEGPNSEGIVVLSGHAPTESLVYADNESTGYSYGQRANASTGAYRFPIAASVGDQISLFYRLDTEDSSSVHFVIPTFAAYPRGGAPGIGAAAGASGQAGATGYGGTAGAAATNPSVAGAVGVSSDAGSAGIAGISAVGAGGTL